MHKLVREVAKKHGLTHAKTLDMLVDFFESLLEEGKIVTQDLVDYFEAEMVEAAKAGEFDAPKSEFLVQPCLDFPPPLPSPSPVVTERLDADTREIVKFLLDNNVRVNTPVQCKFIGDKKAVVELVNGNYFRSQVAVVRRYNGRLLYTTVNFDSPLATIE